MTHQELPDLIPVGGTTLQRRATVEQANQIINALRELQDESPFANDSQPWAYDGTATPATGRLTLATASVQYSAIDDTALAAATRLIVNATSNDHDEQFAHVRDETLIRIQLTSDPTEMAIFLVESDATVNGTVRTHTIELIAGSWPTSSGAGTGLTLTVFGLAPHTIASRVHGLTQGVTEETVRQIARALMSDWAEQGNNDAIPADKLTNAPGGTDSTVQVSVSPDVIIRDGEAQNFAVRVATEANAYPDATHYQVTIGGVVQARAAFDPAVGAVSATVAFTPSNSLALGRNDLTIALYDAATGGNVVASGATSMSVQAEPTAAADLTQIEDFAKVGNAAKVPDGKLPDDVTRDNEVADWAKTGDASLVPDAKIASTITRDNEVSNWAKTGNSDHVPDSKINTTIARSADVQTAITNEANARQQGDSTNSAAISAEEQARIAGDATNAAAVAAETSARENSDRTLQGEIDDLDTKVDNHINSHPATGLQAADVEDFAKTANTTAVTLSKLGNALRWRGPFDPAVTYTPGDVFTRDNTAWLVIGTPAAGTLPPSTAHYLDLGGGGTGAHLAVREIHDGSISPTGANTYTLVPGVISETRGLIEFVFDVSGSAGSRFSYLFSVEEFLTTTVKQASQTQSGTDRSLEFQSRHTRDDDVHIARTNDNQLLFITTPQTDNVAVRVYAAQEGTSSGTGGLTASEVQALFEVWARRDNEDPIPLDKLGNAVRRRGPWSASNSDYEATDVVTHDGGFWMATSAIVPTGSEPSITSTHWIQLGGGGAGLSDAQSRQLDLVDRKTTDLKVETAEAWTAQTDITFEFVTGNSNNGLRLAAGNVPVGATLISSGTATAGEFFLIVQVPVTITALHDYRLVYGDTWERLDALYEYATNAMYRYYTAVLPRSATPRRFELTQDEVLKIEHHGTVVHTKYLGDVSDAEGLPESRTDQQVNDLADARINSLVPSWARQASPPTPPVSWAEQGSTEDVPSDRYRGTLGAAAALSGIYNYYEIGGLTLTSATPNADGQMEIKGDGAILVDVPDATKVAARGFFFDRITFSATSGSYAYTGACTVRELGSGLWELSPVSGTIFTIGDLPNAGAAFDLIIGNAITPNADLRQSIRPPGTASRLLPVSEAALAPRLLSAEKRNVAEQLPVPAAADRGYIVGRATNSEGFVYREDRFGEIDNLNDEIDTLNHEMDGARDNIADLRTKTQDIALRAHTGWTTNTNASTAAFAVTQSLLGSAARIIALPYVASQNTPSDDDGSGHYIILMRAPDSRDSNTVRIRYRPPGGTGSTDRVFTRFVPEVDSAGNKYYQVYDGRSDLFPFAQGGTFTIEINALTFTTRYEGEYDENRLVDKIKDATVGTGDDAGKVIITGTGTTAGAAAPREPTLLHTLNFTNAQIRTVNYRFKANINLDPWTVPASGKFLFEFVEDDGQTFFKEIYAKVWRAKGELTTFQLARNSGGEPIVVDALRADKGRPGAYYLHRGGSNKAFIAVATEGDDATPLSATLKVNIWEL